MKRLAVIRNPSVRQEDHTGKLCIVIAMYVDESIAATHWIEPKDAGLFLAAYGTYDYHDLDGKTCWVEDDDIHMTLIGPAVI
jgi:hypothetical protein